MTWPMFVQPRCIFCALPIDGKRPAVLHLNAYGAKNPRSWWTAPFACEDAALSHEACEHPEWGHGDMGYQIALARLVNEGLEEWQAHLRGKLWFTPNHDDALQQAYALAVHAVRRSLATPTGSRRSAAPRETIPASVRAAVLERDGFRCRRCGHTTDHGVRLVLDHIEPVAHGGSNHIANLQTLCEPCNAGKSDRAPHAHDRREIPT